MGQLHRGCFLWAELRAISVIENFLIENCNLRSTIRAVSPLGEFSLTGGEAIN